MKELRTEIKITNYQASEESAIANGNTTFLKHKSPPKIA
jgi:hypothetical protein